MEFSISRSEEQQMARFWWIPLIVGVMWMMVSLVVLDMDATSAKAVGLLAGLVFIGAGVSDLVFAGVVDRFKWLYAGLGVVLIAIGVIALFHPQNTFVALATVIGWFLLFKGTFDIVLAFMNREFPLWWVTLLAGIVQVGLAFWATGYFGRSAVLLIVWVAASAMLRGITAIVLAFSIRELNA